MLNPLFDAYATQLPEIALPYTVACHRAADAALFGADPSFDRATQGFGWSDSALAYTCGRRFVAPTGLDALLLYYHRRRDDGPELAPLARGVDLYLFAMGQVVERVQVAHRRLPATVGHDGEPRDDGGDEFPTAGDFDIKLARIAPGGAIEVRGVSRQAGRRSEEVTTCAVLASCPRHTRLQRVTVEKGGRTYAFTGAEIAQLEAAVAVHRGVMDFVLPVVVDAARIKYGALGEGAWRLVAGSLGMAVAEAQRRQQERDDWWAGYAAMHDGLNPYDN